MSLKQEYYELVNLLNKGNKQKDLKTEVYFFINEDRTKFYMAIDEVQKLLICQRSEAKRNWQESKASKFLDFEISIARFLSLNKTEEDLTKQIKSFIFK